MKKYCFIMFYVLTCISTTAQDYAELDTIMVNDYMNVTLFFPKPIRQGITGSENFVFTYNREHKQHFGLLQGRTGKASNLLVITDDGQVYSYIIKYADSIFRHNYFLNKLESVGNEIPKVLPDGEIKKETARTMDFTYYDKFSRYFLSQNASGGKSKCQDGIGLKLIEIKYHRDAVYLILEIENRSEIDFEIDYLKVFKVASSKSRKSSFQKLKLNVLYKCNEPNVVLKSRSKRFVYVIPKFTLGNYEKLQLELHEEHGSRQVLLN
ncbi:DUF4138 domain-containing protein [Formosa sp. S-31]|uniref:DUF4138 domain-containing protein n=1 Tax=Formosa sp. S-31 TaxID=2790949 RepID=UPI003EB94F87